MLESVTAGSQNILKEIENATGLRENERYDEKDEAHSFKVPPRGGSLNTTRLVYLAAHLESLRLTLAVLLQTLYTAQSIIWSK